MSSDTPARKRLLLFPQDKGGIGKSFVAALLHDFLAEAGVRLKAFDLDHANSTLNRLVPSAEFINTDVDSDRLAVLDRVIEAFEEADTVLVDNRASGGNKVLAYLEEAQLPELQRDLGLRIVFLLVATDDKNANSQTNFSLAEVDQGRLICLSVPQGYQVERKYLNLLLKQYFFLHAFRRFDLSVSVS